MQRIRDYINNRFNPIDEREVEYKEQIMDKFIQVSKTGWQNEKGYEYDDTSMSLVPLIMVDNVEGDLDKYNHPACTHVQNAAKKLNTLKGIKFNTMPDYELDYDQYGLDYYVYSGKCVVYVYAEK